MKSVYCILFAMTLIALLGTPEAEADTVWSMNGSGCRVDSAYTPQAVVDVSHGSVTFAPGATGWILLNCPVAVHSNPGGPCKHVAITASDPDGSGGNYYIKGWLNYTPLGAGVVGSIAVAVSNSVARALTLGAVNHTFDFNTYYYYVTVEMKRTSTAQNPIFYGTSLGYANPCII